MYVRAAVVFLRLPDGRNRAVHGVMWVRVQVPKLDGLRSGSAVLAVKRGVQSQFRYGLVV